MRNLFKRHLYIPSKIFPKNSSIRSLSILMEYERFEESLFLKNVPRLGRNTVCSHRTPKAFQNATTRSFAFHTLRPAECWYARAPFVHAVCQCAGLDSRGFNTLYRGDCCSLSACSTQPNDRLSSHRGARSHRSFEQPCSL